MGGWEQWGGGGAPGNASNLCWASDGAERGGPMALEEAATKRGFNLRVFFSDDEN